MELQWMLGWDGCDGKVLKKDSDFLGIVSEFNGSGMLDLICTWGSTVNFDTDFFEMGLLTDANKEKGDGRKLRNMSKRKGQKRELSYLRQLMRKRTVMQMDTIHFQCKKNLTCLLGVDTLLDCARMDRLVSTIVVVSKWRMNGWIWWLWARNEGWTDCVLWLVVAKFESTDLNTLIIQIQPSFPWDEKGETSRVRKVNEFWQFGDYSLNVKGMGDGQETLGK